MLETDRINLPLILSTCTVDTVRVRVWAKLSPVPADVSKLDTVVRSAASMGEDSIAKPQTNEIVIVAKKQIYTILFSGEPVGELLVALECNLGLMLATIIT